MKSWKEQIYDKYVSTGQSTGSESLKYRKPYIAHVVKNNFPSDRSVRILDLGCGDGAWIHLLSEIGYENTHGVDISSEQIERAKNRGVKNVSKKDAFEHLNQLKNEIDIMLMIDLIEHFDRSTLIDLIKNAYTSMRKNGKIIIHVPNAQGLFGMSVRYGDLTHEISFTPKSVEQLLRPIGFSDVKVYEHKPVPHGLLSLVRRFVWEIGILPFRLLLRAEAPGKYPILSQNMLVTAVK